MIDKNVGALMRVADRHFLIERGRVVWSGLSRELAAAPTCSTGIWGCDYSAGCGGVRIAAAAHESVETGAAQLAVQPVEQQVDHRRGVEREHLRHQKPADDGDAERPAQFGAGADGDHQRQRAEHRGQASSS